MSSKTITTFLLTLVAFSLSSYQIVIAQVQTHLQEPNSPTPAQIQAFCSQFRVAGAKYQASHKAQFGQYCITVSNIPVLPKASFNNPAVKQPVAPRTVAPRTVAPRIDQLLMPKCLAKGKQIRVTGKNFSHNAVSCTMDPALDLRLLSQTTSMLQFQINATPQARSSYLIRCTAKPQTRVSRRINTCIQDKPAVAHITQQTANHLLPDLAGTLALLPQIQTKGKRQQWIRIEYRNLGKGRNNERFSIEVILSSSKRIPLKTKAISLFGRNPVLVRQTLQGNVVPAPGNRLSVMASIRLPESLLPGDYNWCVRLDTRTNIPESNESNNSICVWQRLGGSPIPTATLSGLFGSKRPKLPILTSGQGALPGEAGSAHRPVPQFLLTLPQNLHTLDGEIPLLVLNRQMVGVQIPTNEAGELGWVIPERSGDQMFLVVSDNNRYFCPTGSLETQRAELEALSAAPDTGVKPREGETTLNLDAYDRPRTYYLWGCAIQSGNLTGIKTNMIRMQYGFTSATVVGHPVSPRPASPNFNPVQLALTDLTVQTIRKVSDNRLFFRVAATNPGVLDPLLGVFAWKITVINLYQYFGITSSESLYGLSDDGRNVFIYQGEGRIQNLGSLGFGAMINTEINHLGSRPWVVWLQINTGPRRPEGSDVWSPFATGPSYPESNYGNNTKSWINGFSRARSVGILNLNVVNTGPGWAIVALRYLKRSFEDIVVTLQLHNASAVPRNDRKIDCTNGPEGNSRITAEYGQHLVYFHCYRPAGVPASFAYTQAIAKLEGANSPPHTSPRSYAYRTYNIQLDWGQRNQPGPLLSDLVAGIDRVESGVAGFGGTVDVTITNRGAVTARDITGLFSLLSVSGPAPFLRTITFPEIRVGQTLTQTIRIPIRIEHIDRNRAKWVVDPGNREIEYNETNNYVSRAMPGAPRVGQVSLAPSYMATGRFTALRDRSGACPDAVGSHAWPVQMPPSPSNREVLVGARTEYEDGVFCDSTWVFAAHGFVDFPVDRYRTLGAMLNSAVLYFQPLGTPAHNTCRQPQVSASAATFTWQRMGSVFSYLATPVVATADNLSSRAGGRYAVDITRLVRSRLIDDGTHFGFRLAPFIGRYTVGASTNCSGYYGNFELILVFGDV